MSDAIPGMLVTNGGILEMAGSQQQHSRFGRTLGIGASYEAAQLSRERPGNAFAWLVSGREPSGSTQPSNARQYACAYREMGGKYS